MERISFVIPCYRSENTLGEVVAEIQATMSPRTEYRYEIILVNDGSPDGVWDVIKKLVSENKGSLTGKRNEEPSSQGCIKGLCFAKNFGQHSALMAGFREAEGDIIVSLDDDGQTPINEVFRLIGELSENIDVVYGTYPDYKQSALRRLGSDLANQMTYYMLNVKESFPRLSSFFVMKRYVCDEILRYEQPYPYIGGLILRATRNLKMVPVKQRKRISGRSGYSLRGLVSLWLNGFTAFSVKPLEFGAYVGFSFAAIGFISALIIIIQKLKQPSLQAGWASTIAVLMIIGGVIMLMLGLIGEYIGRIYICLNNSPQYVIKETIKPDMLNSITDNQDNRQYE